MLKQQRSSKFASKRQPNSKQHKQKLKQQQKRSTKQLKQNKRSFATIVGHDHETGIVHESQAYPTNEYDTGLDRVKGEFATFFRHAVLTKCLTDLTSSGGPITFFNFTGANISHQLKESHLHKDAVHLYKWLRLPLGLRRIPRGIDALKPWLKQFAHANEDVPMDGFGFPKDLYLPGPDYIASKILRPQDKHVIFETREEMIDLASLAFKDDPRVEINTTGLYLESDMKQLIPCKGRPVVYVDLHESTSYEQQARARNAIRGIMKRNPHAAFIVTYPLVEDYHPWEVLDLFASTGMHTGYGTSQFADNMHVERAIVEGIAGDQVLHDDRAAVIHAGGNVARPIFGTWTPKSLAEGHVHPDSTHVFRPKKYWSGAGAMTFNIGHSDYGKTLSDIGDSLRSATGKPPGMEFGMSGPLFEPNSYEVGTGWGHKQSFQIPGISIPEDWQTMTMDEIHENLDRKFVDEVMDKIDYIPMKGGPTNIYDISQEQFRLNRHTKRLIEGDNAPEKSRKEWEKRTPLGVYNRLTNFARAQDLKEYQHTFKAQFEDAMGEPWSAHQARSYGRLSAENQSGFLTATEKFAPTAWELQGNDFFHNENQEKDVRQQWRYEQPDFTAMREQAEVSREARMEELKAEGAQIRAAAAAASKPE